METWIVIFLSLTVLFIGLIVFTLYSMAKRQDERQDYIKMKAMSNTFSVVVGFFIIEIGRDIYNILNENVRHEMDPYVTLFVFCLVYFVSLLFYSRKHA